MSEQRIHTGADAATAGDADPGEGQGLQQPGSHGDLLASGGEGPSADRVDPPVSDEQADTEGARHLREAQDIGDQHDR